MKSMLFFIKETTKGLTKELGEKAEAGVEFELKATFGKFSLDALATCAFGVDAQSFSNEKSVFVKYASAVFINSPIDNILMFGKLIPGVAKAFSLLKINTMKPKATKYLSDVILHALRARKDSGARRNDMIDLMLDAIKEGDNVDENDNSEEVSQYDKDMEFDHKKQSKVTEEEIVATALVFLVAGYDTTGIVLILILTISITILPPPQPPPPPPSPPPFYHCRSHHHHHHHHHHHLIVLRLTEELLSGRI